MSNEFDHETPGGMMREIVGDAIRKQVPPGCAPASREAVSAWVAGVPAPQGSKRALGAGRPGGRIRLVESSTKVKPWRADVRQAFLSAQADDERRGALGPTFGERAPLVVKIVFVMPRTKAMRNRLSADFPMVQKPDVDKLLRAVLDALVSAGVYADDSQVVACHGFKRRAEPGEPTGAMIHVEPYMSALTTIAMAPNAGMAIGAEIAPDVVRREVDGSLTATTAVNTGYDTPETVAAKMRGLDSIRDAAKRHGFTP